MASPLAKPLSRLVPGVFSKFGKKSPLRRALIVTLASSGDGREGGIYLRGKGMPEASARFISWANLVYWAHKPDGRVARRWQATQRETNPDYPRVYADTVRALQFAFPDTWERHLAVLGLKPPTIDPSPIDTPETALTDAHAAVEGPAYTEQPEAPSIYEPKWTKPKEENSP